MTHFDHMLYDTIYLLKIDTYNNGTDKLKIYNSAPMCKVSDHLKSENNIFRMPI